MLPGQTEVLTVSISLPPLLAPSPPPHYHLGMGGYSNIKLHTHSTQPLSGQGLLKAFPGESAGPTVHSGSGKEAKCGGGEGGDDPDKTEATASLGNWMPRCPFVGC